MLTAILHAVLGKPEPHPQTEIAAKDFADQALHRIEVAQKYRETETCIRCSGYIPIGHYDPDLPLDADPRDVIRAAMKYLPSEYRYSISDGRWLGFSVILTIKDIPLD